MHGGLLLQECVMIWSSSRTSSETQGQIVGRATPLSPCPLPLRCRFPLAQFPTCPMICPGSPRMPQEQMNLLAICLNLDHSWLRWGLSGAPFMKAAYWRSCDLWPHSSAINLLLWWKKKPNVFRHQLCHWPYHWSCAGFGWWCLSFCAYSWGICYAAFYHENRYCLQVKYSTGAWRSITYSRRIAIWIVSNEVSNLRGNWFLWTKCASQMYNGFVLFVRNRDVSRYLRLLLRKEGHNFHTSSELEIVRTIKEVRL